MADETNGNGNRNGAKERNSDPTSNVLQLVEAAVKRLDDIAALRTYYIERLAIAESKRVDAIRALDAASVETATEKAVEQASILSSQMTTTTTRLIERIAAVEKMIYEGMGKQSVAAPIVSGAIEEVKHLREEMSKEAGKQTMSDPMLTELIAEMKEMRKYSERRKGQSVGIASMLGYIVGALGILFGGWQVLLAIIK